MEEKNKNMWMIAGIVLVVVAIIIFVVMRNNKDNDDLLENENNLAQEEVVVEDDNKVGELDTTGEDTATSPAASISYQDALVKYKDARLQLDKTCQASPDRMTFKNGASVMLDNRSAVSRTVKVGSTYTIKPYGFRIIKLSASSSSLPVTYLVDCDKSQNVSTILLQG